MNDNFEDEPPKGDGQLPPSEFSDPDEFGVLTQEGAERLSRERGFLRRYEELIWRQKSAFGESFE